MDILHSYQNGNCSVTIYSDGTKVREYEGSPKPEYPESMDVKITNNCIGMIDKSGKSHICSFCHEKSSPNGKHADLDKLLNVISGLNKGTEIAVGGGRVLSHPNVVAFFEELKKRGIIANMTENQSHCRMDEDTLINLLDNRLIYGLGISINDFSNLNVLDDIIEHTNNLVFHVIMGITDVNHLKILNNYCLSKNKKCKVLVLGYKDFGFGSKHYSLNKLIVDENKIQWYRYLANYFNEENMVLSFDNLAIDQLNLKRFFDKKTWDKFYMGNEGKFSIYIDAVEQQFAICSVDPNRVSFDKTDLKTFFQNIRN